jgi:transcriptional regulator with XRE-family HTH domain
MATKPTAPVLTLGELIQRRRIERGLTQEQLSRLLEVSAITISRWERGKFAPDPTHAPALARFLGGAPDDFLAA